MLPSVLILALAGFAAAASNKQPGICKQGVYGALSPLGTYKPAREFCVKEFGYQAVVTVTADSRHKTKRGITALPPSTTPATTSSSIASSSTTPSTTPRATRTSSFKAIISTKCTTVSSAVACSHEKECHGSSYECMLSSAKFQKKDALKTLCSCIVPTKTVTVPCKTTSTSMKSTTKSTTQKSTIKNTTKCTTSKKEASSSSLSTTRTSSSSTTASSAAPSPTIGCSDAQKATCSTRFTFCAISVADGMVKCPGALCCNDPCTNDADCASLRGAACFTGESTCGEDKKFCAIVSGG